MKFDDAEKVLVVNFGELWLRGRNRGNYIKLLKDNLRVQLSGESYRLEQMYDRLIIRLAPDSDENSIKTKLAKLFGVSTITVAYATPPDLESISRTAKMMLERISGEKSLRINSHRSHKDFPFDSRDVIDRVSKVAKSMGFLLKSHGFATDLYISITKDAAFLTHEKIKGQGGLPVRSSGRAVVLFSGGIDSPVAAWYAMKRGIEPIFVHVHGYGNTEEVLSSKIPKILGILSTYHRGAKIYYVPSHILQSYSLKAGRYELILLKAFMLAIAEKIAKKEGATAIVTGESLGQVASQTMQNLTAEQHGIKLPVLRPLVGFDKEEIIRVARSIGTYEESIKPYKDVCSINAKNPATSTTIERIKELKKSVGLPKLVTRSIKMSEINETG